MNNNPNPTPTPAPAPGRKVFDVMRPGQAPAHPASRPVVDVHKDQAQSAQASVSGVGARPMIMDSRQKVEIKPPAGAEGQAPSSPNVGWLPHDGASDVDKNPIFADPPKTDTQTVAAGAGGVAAQASVVGATQPVSDTAMPELDVDHKPVVSQHKTHSAWHTWLLIIVILLLAAVVLDILLDAEIFSIPGVPHTNLF